MSKYGLLNPTAVDQIITKTLEDDMKKSLDAIVDEVVGRLKDTVRANVAARMIALAQSDYSMEYLRNELRIYVKLETK